MKKYVTRKEKKAFALAGIAIYLVAGIAQSYLMIFLTDVLYLSASFVMVLMIVSRVWDAINDPIMGMVVDGTSTKKGKLKPYVFIGAFIIGITTILLFIPLQNLSTSSKMIYTTIIYLLFGMAYTFVEVPTMGLLSVSTSNTEERSNLLAFYVTIGTIGGMLPVGLLPIFEIFIPETWLYFSLSLVTGIYAFFAFYYLSKKSKERFVTNTEKIPLKEKIRIAITNKPMLQTLLMSMIASPRYLMLPALVYIAKYVYQFGNLSWGTGLIILYVIIGAGMFIGIIFATKLAIKFGYKQMCIFSSLVGGISMTLAYVLGVSINLYVALPLLTIGGLALGVFNVLPHPMVGESLDYLEWKTGERLEGVCFSLNSFVTKFNNAVGFVGLAVGLVVFKYVAPALPDDIVLQSTTTINGLLSLITIIPGISFFLSIIPMLFYKFNGKEKERILKELHDKHENDGITAQE